jgi:hypothetical protein|tara:strand:- start:274 stop:804 length:531 start_codon:yes stop_codon:yes gene_type:complete
MRQKSKLRKGIAASTKGSKSIKEKTKTLLQMMEEDAMGWKDLPKIAMMFYDNPTEVIGVLRKGSTLFRQTPIESYVLCSIIYEEIERRKRDKKKLKIDPDYTALNRVVSDKLQNLCACIGVKYNNVMLAKSSKAKRTISMTMDRQQIIDRCIERYRRLAVRQNKKFVNWYNENRNQ